MKPSITKTDAKAIEQQLKTAKQVLVMQQAKSVAEAKNLTELEVKKLEHKAKDKPLSPEEIHALESFYIAQFYRLEQVQTDDVIRDRQGKTRREVRNLEMVLNGALAEHKSAESIESNPDTPQDWSRAVVQHQLLEMSGMGQLIRDIYAGQVAELEWDRTDTIASQLQAYPQEYQLAFGFSNIDKVPPMQAVSTVLNWCGIKRTVHRRRQDGEVLRIYRIDPDHLVFIQKLLVRRSEPDPALGIDEYDQGGGSNAAPSYVPFSAEDRGQNLQAHPLHRSFGAAGAMAEAG